MKIKGRITILIGREETRISIEDENANMDFVEVILTPEQLSAALSRIANTECEIEVRGLDKVGKKHECRSFEFEIPDNLKSSTHAEALQKIAQSQISNGWIADSYFGSQNSFFSANGKQYARCTIRRWT